MSKNLFLPLLVSLVLVGSQDVLASRRLPVIAGPGIGFQVISDSRVCHKAEVFGEMAFLKRWESPGLRPSAAGVRWKAEFESRISAARAMSISA